MTTTTKKKDDVGADSFEAYGSGRNTPHTTQMAREGFVGDYFFMHPVCTPSR